MMAARTLPLWIADQVRNDGVVVPGRIVSRFRGNDGHGTAAPELLPDDSEAFLHAHAEKSSKR